MIGSAVVLLIAVMVVGLGVRAVLREGRGTVKEPVCGGCRYPVRGLQSLYCPECGADLREVGIQTSAMRLVRPPSLAGQAVMWTIVVALVGGILAAIVGHLPMVAVSEASVRMTLTPRGGPINEWASQRGPIKVWASGEGRRGVRPGRRFDMALVGGGPGRQLLATRDGDRWVVGTERTPLSEATILALIAPRNPSEADAAMAAELWGLAQAAAVDVTGVNRVALGEFVSTGSGVGITTKPPRWFLAISGVTLVLVWGGGLYLLVKGRERRSRGS